ncbi:beta-xylosidase [Seiridium cupressi]
MRFRSKANSKLIGLQNVPGVVGSSHLSPAGRERDPEPHNSRKKGGTRIPPFSKSMGRIMSRLQHLSTFLTPASQVQLYGVPTGAGVWAPSLAYIGGLFYAVSMTRWTYDPVARVWPRVYFHTSPDLIEWSDATWCEPWGIDPSIFLDPKSNKTYLTLMAPNNNVDRIWGIYGLWNGTLPHNATSRDEGPKLFYKDPYYYLLIAEGGTDDLHRSTIARSDSPEGPWDPAPNNPILFNGAWGFDNLTVQSTGHATLVESEDGNWYASFLARRKINGSSPLGRETFLTTVTWEDDWPVLNKGRPITLTESIPGITAEEPNLETFVDNFCGSELEIAWYQLRVPYTRNYHLESQGIKQSTCSGSHQECGIIMHPNVFGLSDRDVPAALLRKQKTLNMTFSAALLPSNKPLNSLQTVGVSVYLSEWSHQDVGVKGCSDSAGLCVYSTILMNTTVLKNEIPLNQSTIPQDLTLHIRAEPLKYSLGYALGQSATIWVAELSSSWMAWAPTGYYVFSGASWAIFASGGGEPWTSQGATVGFKEIREEYYEENIPDFDVWNTQPLQFVDSLRSQMRVTTRDLGNLPKPTSQLADSIESNHWLFKDVSLYLASSFRTFQKSETAHHKLRSTISIPFRISQQPGTMSTASPTPELTAAAKPQRVLACVLCQQRKIKCDREFPCAHCTRAGAQCVPSTTHGRQRRRRFPERELLERLRHYEGLLGKNKIEFQPLHPSEPEHASPNQDIKVAHEYGEDAQPGAQGPVPGTQRPPVSESATKPKPVNLWSAISKRTLGGDIDGDDSDGDSDSSQDNDVDARAAVIKRAWDRAFEGKTNDHLLIFGSPEPNIDLSTLHPPHAQIFRLWQIYLENVDPLLKVTHTPTLQIRIIDAGSDMTSISPTLEALMFSIYCVAVLSLDEDGCRSLFGTPKKDLLTTYQFACRQALQNCRVLRSSDRDCLTALFLYLMSVRPETDPRSLSSMLGMAIRIAKRIGMHSMASYAKSNALEAEMSRRLWWALVIFDNRICEMFDYPNSTLAPTWDCETPSNVNDFEIRLEMKTPAAAHQRPTEALFAVLRSELGNFVRHSTFHLNFINPSLKFLASSPHQGLAAAGDLTALEKETEEKYLALCDPENPFHFMIIWTTRGYLAKSHLLRYYSEYLTSSMQQTDAQHDATVLHAMRMLESDTILITSPLVKGYQWFVEFQFPFPAYTHMLQDLKQRPSQEYAARAWDIMSENYMPRVQKFNHKHSPILVIFSRMVLSAWKAREASTGPQDRPLEIPLIVSDMRNRVKPLATSLAQAQKSSNGLNIDLNDVTIPSHPGPGPPLGAGTSGFVTSVPWGMPHMSMPTTMDVDMTQFDWTTIDWNSLYL